MEDALPLVQQFFDLPGGDRDVFQVLQRHPDKVQLHPQILQLIHGEIKPEIGYHIRADHQRKGYAKEAATAVRDWTFQKTPFNMVYSYMKYTNEPSARTAMAYGCKQVDTFADEQNGITRVFAISREQWQTLQDSIPIHK